ncbi:hypothetical protein MNBD_DELTA03-593 [hydrothermal vent metagenome]|uniref:Cytochrome c-552/4 domain-containing protein n=1 Tax=hydrothermal vent metagenome TaxID=652676 RepID=A0A3B0W9M5_9ZZZZ
MEHRQTGLFLKLATGFIVLAALCLSPWAGKASEFSGQPLARFSSPWFTGSANCAICHDLLVDEKGGSVSIKSHWRSTMMANAANDPLWQTKVISEIRRNPALKKLIEKKCAACHMPMAELEAERSGGAIAIKPGFADPDNKLHKAAMDGVSCSLCHQIKADNLGRPASFSGQYVIDRKGAKPQRKIYGPHANPSQQIMRSSVGYTVVQGKQMTDSGLCATCHTLYTPFVDAQGKVAGTFPEQTPYLEWQASVYSQQGAESTCQGCHMPMAQGRVQVAVPSGAPARANFAQHHFVGGNITMLRLMRRNIPALKLTASSADFKATMKRTIKQLQDKTARIKIIKIKRRGTRLNVRVEVINLAGHKFPTGIPGRRAWIHFSVRDQTGNILFESGRPLKGDLIAGNDNDVNINTYEPHYKVITSPQQVQIYETIMANSDGKVTYTLLRAASFLKDNRLLPQGFNKEKAAADIKVYGRAAADKNFTGQGDIVTYKVKLKKSSAGIIQAELLYSPVSPAFVMDLKKDAADPEVKQFLKYWRETDRSPVQVAVTEGEMP